MTNDMSTRAAAIDRAIAICEHGLTLCRLRDTDAAKWDALETEWRDVRVVLEGFARKSQLDTNGTAVLRSVGSTLSAYRTAASMPARKGKR